VSGVTDQDHTASVEPGRRWAKVHRGGKARLGIGAVEQFWNRIMPSPEASLHEPELVVDRLDLG
jgi:hypothetical protein